MMRPMQAEGFVLTGGRSSRFGSDKALFPFRGRPMALRVADALQTLVHPVTLVGDPATYGSLGLPVIPDQMAGAGPLAGIVASLEHASAPWILVAACDMPKLRAAPLKSLLEVAARSNVAAVMPRTPDGHLQPLCAMYSQQALVPLATALRAGTRKVTEAVSSLAWKTLEVEDGSPFTNINRPRDLDVLD